LPLRSVILWIAAYRDKKVVGVFVRFRTYSMVVFLPFRRQDAIDVGNL
jgi:hypothetical protein